MARGLMASVKLFAILICFFLSGAAGLVYQVSWGKALGLVFGHTVYAIATVLAVFMGGLAWGSAWLARWSARHAHPVALYGWIELGVAAAAAASLAGLAGVRALYAASFHSVASSPAALLALRFLGAAVVLLLPTFLMGGTLPILVRGLARSSSDFGLRISRLYWVNTAGAVVGTLAAGFLLLPSVGLRLTVAAGFILNVLAGTTALFLSRAGIEASATPGSNPVAPRPLEKPARHLSRFLLAGFAVVGATAMAYEIGWTRLLSTMLGSSTYAFTLMLATFLAGIALGSLLFERWVGRGKQVHLSTFALTQTLTALAALLFLVYYQQLPSLIPPLLRATHETFRGLIITQFVTSALAMLPTAILFGFNFPAVTLLIAGPAEGSGDRAVAVGYAYAANTLGAIVGATLTGFWLLPWLGSFRVLALAAGVNLLLAALLELRSGTRLRRVMAVMTNLALVAVVAAAARSDAFYKQTLATFGTVLYWNNYGGQLTVAETAATTDIIFAADGLNASVSVARAEDYIALRSNGKVEASNHDSSTQLLVGHLGAIFHPMPRRVLVIGFGSGMTVSAVARYPEVERIDCVEIEPAVLRAAPYLEKLNRGVLRDPRLRVILDDARNFLLTTSERYDLIISEPSNPWIAGVASLFTEEYYRAARARLTPGGTFVQWVQAYSLYPEDLRMVLATFVPQFPQVTLWRAELPDLLLLAPTDPAPLRLDQLRTLWSQAALRADYESLGLRQPEGLLAFHLLDDTDLRRAAAGTVRNTDDHTRLEYRAPRALLAKQLHQFNDAMLREYRQTPLPQDFPGEERNWSAILPAMVETFLNREMYDEAERYLGLLVGEGSTASNELLHGRLALARGRLPQAKAAFASALRLDSSSLDAVLGLAEVARRIGDRATAERLLHEILTRDPNFVPALDAMISVARARDAWSEAAQWQRQRIAADAEPGADQYCRLAGILQRLGDSAGAEKALLTALEHDPYSYDAHRSLGQLYRAQQLWPQARAHLEFVVRYFPDRDSQTYNLLADVLRATGETAEANRIVQKSHRIMPASRSSR